MQVVSRGDSRASDSPDMLPQADITSLPDIQFSHVCIQSGKTSAMPDYDIPAIAAAISRFVHFPTARSINGSAGRDCDVYACMEYSSLFHRMHPLSKTGRNSSPSASSVEGEQNRIVSQYRNRHAALPYKILSPVR